jgi:hypothetical protein
MGRKGSLGSLAEIFSNEGWQNRDKDGSKISETAAIG